MGSGKERLYLLLGHHLFKFVVRNDAIAVFVDLTNNTLPDFLGNIAIPAEQRFNFVGGYCATVIL
jgi:hypothetical protein